MHNKLTLILAMIIATLSLNAQHTEIADIRAEAWPTNDPYASITEVPEKWNDASAVIIFQSYQRAYTKKGKVIRNASALRKRLKIQDNSALEAYSEFAFGSIDNDQGSFNKKSDFVVGEIKIIKADGTSFLINLDEAVDDGDGGKKVALSNLEVGDIIDYYYYQHDAFADSKGHAFTPVISTLGEEYPIMHQDLKFKVSKKFYVAFNAYNGAPEVKTIESQNDDTVTYMIEDHDRDAESYTQWFHPNRELPVIKFQVIQANKPEEMNGLKVFSKFTGKKLKQAVYETDVLDLARRSFLIKKIKDKGLDTYVNANCSNCGAHRKLELAYNYLRYDRFVDMYENFSYMESGMDVAIYDYGNTVMSEVQFINVMAGYLYNEGIDFEILATVPRRFGSLENVLLADEISYIIRVKNGNQSVFLSQFAANTEFNQIPYELQGQEAYALQYNSSGLYLKPSFESFKIPESSALSNMTSGIAEISWADGEMDKVNIKRRSIMTGHNKDFDRSDLVSIYDIVDEETNRLQLADPATRIGKKNAKADEFNAAIAVDKVKVAERLIHNFEESTAAEYEFQLEDYQNPELVNTGRWEGAFEYTDEFATSDLIKKAGKNYIFEIGKLIGKQMSIDKDEADRAHNIYMAFARSFKEQVILDIPEGYTVEGLDRLNVKVENSTGLFTSTAEIIGGKLHLNTLKQYKNNKELVQNWPSMLEFLEAAYELSQEKILLKKAPNTTSAALGK